MWVESALLELGAEREPGGGGRGRGRAPESTSSRKGISVDPPAQAEVSLGAPGSRPPGVREAAVWPSRVAARALGLRSGVTLDE